MPPRIPSSVPRALAALPTTPAITTPPGLASQPPRSRRSASTRTLPLRLTSYRRNMFKFLEDVVSPLDDATRAGPRYLPADAASGDNAGRHPFPANRHFNSDPVLSESFREMIWRRAVPGGESLKVLSAEIGVDLRRVAAVVRLKEVEKKWEAEVSWNFLVLPSSTKAKEETQIGGGSQ